MTPLGPPAPPLNRARDKKKKRYDVRQTLAR
jgi:hypothetical protein